MSIAIISLAGLFFLGHFLSWIFAKTKIPDVLILISIGYFLGPVTGIVQLQDLGRVGEIISTIALIVILYEGGIHLSARELARTALPATGIAILGFLFIVACVFTITVGSQGWQIALLLGVCVGGTSSAVVIPMVKYLSIQDHTKTILSLESAFTDILTIVSFLVILDAVTSGFFSASSILVGLGPVTLASILAGIGLGLIWAFMKKRFSEITSMTFAGEAWALLSYGVMDSAGLNGALAVLALGFTLGNLNLLPDWGKKLFDTVPVSYRELGLLREISFTLKTFFFIYLGLLVSFGSVQIILLALLITVLIFVTRYLCARILYRPAKFNLLDVATTNVMGPRGLACAVLASLPAQRGLIGGEWIQQVAFAVIPISILFTAIAVFAVENPQIRRKLAPLFPGYLDDGISSAPLPATPPSPQ